MDELTVHTPSRREPSRMTQQDLASVVPIQVGARGAGAAFLVPGAGATVSAFLSLAQCFGPDTTLYGLQPRGFDGALPPHATVEEAATEFVACIRKICPRGPYRIVGHSFGGWIAYEIGLRLAALGESLHSVIMLDSEPPGFLDEPPESLTPREERVWTLLRLCRLLEMSAGTKFNIDQDQLEVLAERQQLEALGQAMKAAGMLSPASRLAVVESMVRVFAVNLRTYYVPAAVVPGEVVLVFPEEQPDDDPDEEPLDIEKRLEQWRRHVPHLRTVSTPGNHMTMLDSPNVTTIGQLLNSLWGRRTVCG